LHFKTDLADFMRALKPACRYRSCVVTVLRAEDCSRGLGLPTVF
jgi:hypothetical protein